MHRRETFHWLQKKNQLLEYTINSTCVYYGPEGQTTFLNIPKLPDNIYNIVAVKRENTTQINYRNSDELFENISHEYVLEVKESNGENDFFSSILNDLENQGQI